MSIFEIKSRQQIRSEKILLKQAKEQYNNKQIRIHQLTHQNQPNTEEQKNNHQESQPLLIQTDRQIDHDQNNHSASERLEDDAESSVKIYEKIERRYVKIKVKKISEIGKAYKILTCKQVLEPMKVEIKNTMSNRSKSKSSRKITSKSADQ